MAPHTIGLIGGMSWESTVIYYQMINRVVRAELGGLESAPIILHSLNFAEIASLQRAGDWDRLAEILSSAAQGLERSGAEYIAICTNTMHKVAEEVQAAVSVPLIDIRDSSGLALQQDAIETVSLFGTLYTMQQTFFSDYLLRQWDIRTVPPDLDAQQKIHTIIFDELCKGNVRPESRELMNDLISEMMSSGVQAVVLGCTELMLLFEDAACSLPVYDTTTLHANTISSFALDLDSCHQSKKLQSSTI